jgi:hypothetical protein
LATGAVILPSVMSSPTTFSAWLIFSPGFT